MGINLTATNHVLELVTTGTGAVHVVVSFVDEIAGVKTGGSQVSVITTATTTTIVSAPAASTTRSVHHINIQAVVANTITVQKDVAATEHVLIGPTALTAGQRLEFTASVGWKRTDAAGSGTISLTAIAAGSFLANVTAGVTAPGAHDLATFAAGGLTYTNVTGLLAVGAGTGITVNANDVQLTTIADDTFMANVSGGAAVATGKTFASLAGDGLTYDATNHELDVVGSTSIVITGDQVQRAAITGDVTAAQNSNTSAFRSFAAKSVLVNATNGSAVPSDLAGSGAFQYLRVNSGNTGLEWAVLSLSAFPTMAAGTVLANITAGTAVPTAHALSTLAGAGLTYTNVTGIMAVGAGTRITVNADDVQLAAGAAESFLMNATAGSAVADYRAGTSVAGAGLTYTAGGTLAVGSSTSITVNADDVQRSALTGDITAAVNVNTTAFRTFSAKSVLANATNASAVPTELAGSAAFQHLRVNSANTALEWAVLAVTSPITLTSDNIGFDQTVALGNNARVAVSKNSGATVGTRRRINLIEGTGVTLTIADDAGNEEVDVTIASAATAGTVTPTTLSIFGTPTNTGVPFIIYVTFAAGAGGSADDVTVFSSSAPFNFRILESWLITTTAVALSTVQARTATGGGGTALSTAMSATVAGKTSDNSTATATVAASGTMVLRRSDSGIAGEFFAMAIRT